MKAREYLQQIRIMDIKIGQRITELSQMRDRISIISGIDYSKDRVQTSPTTGNKQIETLVDLEAEISRMINKEAELKHRIIGEIQQLENPIYVDVLFRRYVDCQYFEEIAVDMMYSYSRIRHIHADALRAFERYYLESTHDDTDI